MQTLFKTTSVVIISHNNEINSSPISHYSYLKNHPETRENFHSARACP